MSRPSRVVVIERQDFWRQRCASALEDSGYAVLQLSSYDLAGRLPPPEATDLVILGCTHIGPAEVRLVGEIRERREPVLLVCTLTETQGVREGLCAGAGDVVERPYEPGAIVAAVERALAGASGPLQARSASAVEVSR